MKKRKLTINRTLGSVVNDSYKELIGSPIFDEETMTLNGVPLDQIVTKMNINFKLPPGIHGACHECRPVKYFKSIDELFEHSRTKHASWRH